jgi:hypothetical protein
MPIEWAVVEVLVGAVAPELKGKPVRIDLAEIGARPAPPTQQ